MLRERDGAQQEEEEETRNNSSGEHADQHLHRSDSDSHTESEYNGSALWLRRTKVRMNLSAVSSASEDEMRAICAEIEVAEKAYDYQQKQSE